MRDSQLSQQQSKCNTHKGGELLYIGMSHHLLLFFIIAYCCEKFKLGGSKLIGTEEARLDMTFKSLSIKKLTMKYTCMYNTCNTGFTNSFSPDRAAERDSN